MDPEFWRERWREGRTAFHEGRPNELLERHLARLGRDRRVLVPLCGKAEDMAYLAAAGHHVVGIEVVAEARQQFFDAHPGIRGVEILTADFFAVTPEAVGACDALYDRAALIALPPETRPRYVAHLRTLVAPGAAGLLVTLEYPQDAMAGPPFSVPAAEVDALWPGAELLEEIESTSERMRAAGIRATERIHAIGNVPTRQHGG